MAESGASLLVHPVVGVTRDGDVSHYARVRCYRALMPRYPAGAAMLSLLPLAMRMAGPREAVWHSVIRRNYGCSHFIVGRDHAGPGKDSAGRWFYDPLEAQDLVRRHAGELGITMVPFRDMVYVPSVGRAFRKTRFRPAQRRSTCRAPSSVVGWPKGPRCRTGSPFPRSSTSSRGLPAARTAGVHRLLHGLVRVGQVGDGQSAPVAAPRRRAACHDARRRRSAPAPVGGPGVLARGPRHEHPPHRLRGREITKHGGAVICAAIAPYEATRQQVRERISASGGFVLVHVSTPIETCEQRDAKGSTPGREPEF